MVLPAGVTFKINIANDYVSRRHAAATPWWRWRELAAVPIAASAMLACGLVVAAEPWARVCNPASVRPFALATVLLLIAADLLMLPRREWSRSRNNAVMNTGCVAALAMLVFCVVSNGWFAWPVLFPLLVFPLTLVLLPVFGIGLVAWLPLSAEVRRWAVAISLVLAAALVTIGQHAYQAHIACRWPGA